MRRGFTLVELSIVLVIIGLLIGGILVAQSMISTAKIQSQIKQIEEIKIAITNFKTNYKCLPADCAILGSGGSQPGATTPGNNDGRVLGYLYHNNVQADAYNVDGNHQWINWTYWRSEWASVFDHLAATNMYKFTPYDETDLTAGVVRMPGIFIPKMALDKNTSYTGASAGGVVFGYEPGPVSYMNPSHKIKLGWCGGFMCGPNPTNAAAMDAKLDDGNPYSGGVYLTGNSTFRVPSGLVNDETSACGNSATNKYRVQNQTAGCIVTIEVDF